MFLRVASVIEKDIETEVGVEIHNDDRPPVRIYFDVDHQTLRKLNVLYRSKKTHGKALTILKKEGREVRH